MRKFATGTVLLSVLAIGVFGFLAMHPGEMERMAGCIAAVVSGATCPATSPLEQSMFHVDAFKSLSLATFADSALLVALIFVALCFVGTLSTRSRLLRGFGGYAGNKTQEHLASRQRFWEAVYFTPLALRRLLRNLSFFTHSPCAA